MRCERQTRSSRGVDESWTEIERLPPTPFLRSVKTVFDGPPTAPPRERGELLAGRYTLDRSVSGRGHVYAAEDIIVRRQVAVKMLRRNWARDALLRDRFEQAVQALARAEHGNVVRVLDLLVAESALVMEYVHGSTLAELVAERGPLAPPRALHIAAQICAGLHAAHGAGVVHGDLRAANVIVGVDAESAEVPKLVGFVLAPGGDPANDASELADEPTPRHPEVRGDLGQVGKLLYFMLTGHEARAPRVDRERLRVTLERSSSPVAAARVAFLVERALGLHREQPFSTAQELGRTIRGALRTSPARAEAPGEVRGGPRRTRRRLVAAWLLAMLVAALLGFWLARRHTRASDERALTAIETSNTGGR